MLDSEAEFFVKRLGDFLAVRWERPYSAVMGWVRACPSFAILQTALLCACVCVCVCVCVHACVRACVRACGSCTK